MNPPVRGSRGQTLAATAGMTLGLVIVLAGCQAQIDAAGEPGDTQVIVGRSSSGLTVEAPAWRPPQTLIYLCPAEPTKTFAEPADAGTLQLSADCRSYGVRDSGRGLDLTLGFGTIDAARRPTFEAAPTWWLVLIGIRDGTTDRVFRTAIDAVLIDPSITPGPAEPAASPGGSPAAPASAAP